MIGYICLNKRKMDLKHVRYEIGKIYKSKINCFDTLENLLMYYNEKFFINIKNNNLNFYDVVDFIFDVFENEGFKNIDIDFINDYFNFINFSELFKRKNLISYMMKNTNLSFSRFNSFNC